MPSTVRLFFYPFIALTIGLIMDFYFGDPEGLPHPVILIGKLINAFKKLFRKLFSHSDNGEKAAGAAMFLVVTSLAFIVPFGLLSLCYTLSPFLGIAVEAIMCWQILATKSLRDACMKVYRSLRRGNTSKARQDVSHIVGRDVVQLDESGIIRAAVETAAENTCDGSIAPLFYLVIGGAPMGWLYKAVNTMDSMVGYIDEPYKNFGLIPARADDAFNFIPARISALLMLLSGFVLNLNVSNGWKIFKRDRYNHASPNSAQTESVCAGLLDVQLGGNASYHGIIHEKKSIGDPVRHIEANDIRLTCSLLYNTAILAAVIFLGLKLLLIFLLLTI